MVQNLKYPIPPYPNDVQIENYEPQYSRLAMAVLGAALRDMLHPSSPDHRKSALKFFLSFEPQWVELRVTWATEAGMHPRNIEGTIQEILQDRLKPLVDYECRDRLATVLRSSGDSPRVLPETPKDQPPAPPDPSSPSETAPDP